jgi:outer membrane receptor for ferrienterochelin and colicins
MLARRALSLLVPLTLAATAAAQSAPQGQTIVVSATRHAMPQIDAPAAIDVITRADIEVRGADNIFEAVRGETGISIQGRTVSGRRTLNLRGMDARHTLMLVDGKRIGASDSFVAHSDFQYDWIAVDDIERIEVIRGPMSVLYGAEALGGVVNIITRSPGRERWSLGAMVEGSVAEGDLGGNGHRASLHADGPLGADFRLGVSVSQRRRQAIANQEDARISDLEGQEKSDAAVRLVWDPAPGHELVAEHRFGEETRWADLREKSGRKRYYASITPVDREHSSLGWTGALGGALDARASLRIYRSTLQTGNTRSNGVASLRPQALDDRVGEGQFSIVPAAGQLSSAGFELRREEVENVGLAGGHGRADNRALYLEHEARLAPTVTLTGGLRYDHHSRFGHEWSPRAYLVWKAAPGWTVKGGYGHGFKAPTLKQNSADYLEDEGPFTFRGNAALRPESNDAVEIGVGWSSPQLGVQAMLFHNRVTDLIVTRPIGMLAGRALYTFENTDKATLQGLESGATWKPTRAWTLAASWQWLDATDGSGQRLERRPRHQFGLRAGWASGPWSAGGSVERSKGLILAAPVAGEPAQPVPSITMMSAHASVALPHGLELGLGVINLGNVNLADESPLFLHAEVPRTWRLTLRGRW